MMIVITFRAPIQRIRKIQRRGKHPNLLKFCEQLASVAESTGSARQSANTCSVKSAKPLVWIRISGTRTLGNRKRRRKNRKRGGRKSTRRRSGLNGRKVRRK